MGQLQSQANEWRTAFEVKREKLRNSKQYNLQIKLIVEEYSEVIEAFEKFDDNDPSTHEHLLKELGDLVFVCYQMAANMNWDLDEAMQRIFDSNMSKLVDGRAMFDERGKVMKGPNYRLPTLSDLV
jgi:NTP pyrophosphatase (non-canonical NTP hydrolase)